jgi:hypothetical protein
MKDRPGPLRIVEFEAWVNDGPEVPERGVERG